MNFQDQVEERRGRRYCGVKSDHIFIGLSTDLTLGHGLSTVHEEKEPKKSGHGELEPIRQEKENEGERRNSSDGVTGNSVIVDRLDRIRGAQMKQSHSLHFDQFEDTNVEKTGKRQYRNAHVDHIVLG